jgi:hypothetical protein
MKVEVDMEVFHKSCSYVLEMNIQRNILAWLQSRKKVRVKVCPFGVYVGGRRYVEYVHCEMVCCKIFTKLLESGYERCCPCDAYREEQVISVAHDICSINIPGYIRRK